MTYLTPSRLTTGDHNAERVAALLKEARKKIEQPKNWGKGLRRARKNFYSCCIAEAIEEARGFSADRKSAFDRLYEATDIPRHFGGITTWNDAPERTHAEVLAAFDKAIAACSGRGSPVVTPPQSQEVVVP